MGAFELHPVVPSPLIAPHREERLDEELLARVRSAIGPVAGDVDRAEHELGILRVLGFEVER